jgi:hypothetical protein
MLGNRTRGNEKGRCNYSFLNTQVLVTDHAVTFRGNGRYIDGPSGWVDWQNGCHSKIMNKVSLHVVVDPRAWTPAGNLNKAERLVLRLCSKTGLSTAPNKAKTKKHQAGATSDQIHGFDEQYEKKQSLDRRVPIGPLVVR